MKKIKSTVASFKSFSRKKKITVILVIALVGFFIYRSTTRSPDTTYQFGNVERGSVSSLVSESGEVMTTGSTDVTSSINGIVTEVYVSNNDSVTRGQKLFKVESTATAEERTKAYATYQSARSSLESAQSSYRSAEATAAKVLDSVSGHDSDETLEMKETRTKAESARDNAYYSVRSNEANVSNAWLAYQATIDGVVISPATGIVNNLSVAPTQHVDSNTKALIVSTKDADTWVKLTINETDIKDLKADLTAEITIDVLADTTFEGTVRRIDSIGTIESGVVTYNVYIELQDPIDTIRPGMTVQVTIETEKRENVLLVPNAAIRPYQGGRALQVLDESGQVLYLPITVGIVGNTKSEVVKGVTDGQRIIISQSGSSTQSSGPFSRPN